jgi:hypothetical protein
MNTKAFFKNLGKQNLSELERKTSLSRRALGSAKKSHNMKLDNLENLAEALGLSLNFVPVTDEENVLSSLKRFEAPLAHKAGGNLDLGQALVASFKFARIEGLYESVVPYVMAVNANNLNPRNLVAMTQLENGEVAVLGYFAQMANEFSPHPHLTELVTLAALFHEQKPKKETLIKNEKVNFVELFEKNRVALRWGFLARGTLKDHLDRWNKWQLLQKTP